MKTKKMRLENLSVQGSQNEDLKNHSEENKDNPIFNPEFNANPTPIAGVRG